MVSQLPFNRKVSARLLIELANFFPTGLFHRPGLAVKDLPPHQPNRPKYKLEDVLVDALFANILRLPTNEYAQIYYISLMTEVTKSAPNDIAPTLGRAIRWIYDRFDDIEGELNMRFSTWFSIHLSNFGFNYKWTEWYFACQTD
jgi:nuclear cap-binding protein subunit 1